MLSVGERDVEPFDFDFLRFPLSFRFLSLFLSFFSTVFAPPVHVHICLLYSE